MHKQHKKLPVVVMSGASGFIGSHLIQTLRENYFIYALARRSQKSADIPLHKNIKWIRLNISNERDVQRIMAEISQEGGADYFIHLAGFYDFRNRPDPEYTLTNVRGTLNVLEAAKSLHLKRFIFASSLAAIRFFNKDMQIDEFSQLDATYPYALSKRKGEDLVQSYSTFFPCTTIRLAAIFSDYCEYLPLYYFLSTWLSNRWDRRILVGKGRAAIPYLHIQDLVRLVELVLEKSDQLSKFQVLHASPSSSTSQNELFNAAHHYIYFQSIKPIYISKYLAAVGVILKKMIAFFSGNPLFVCLWMLKYVDEQLVVKSWRTQHLMGWRPTDRYSIGRRLLFMIDTMKANPYKWHMINLRRMIKISATEIQSLKIYEAMVSQKDQIITKILERLSSGRADSPFKHYQGLSAEACRHAVEHIYKLLEIDVGTGDRSHILEYAELLAEHRFLENFPLTEVKAAIRLTSELIVKTLASMENLNEMHQQINDEIAITLQMVMDEVEDTYLLLEAEEKSGAL